MEGQKWKKKWDHYAAASLFQRRTLAQEASFMLEIENKEGKRIHPRIHEDKGQDILMVLNGDF